MAPDDRAERRQMRQRGAGITNVQNTNFGFRIGGGAPLQSRRSRRPSPSLRGPRSSRSTPNELPERLSARSRRSRTPAQDATESHKRRSTSIKGPSSSSKTPQQPASVPKESDRRSQSFVTPTVTGKRKRTPLHSVDEKERERDELEQDDVAHRASAERRSVRMSILPSVSEQPQDHDAEDDLANEHEDYAPMSVDSSRRQSGIAAAARRRSLGRKSQGTLNLQGHTPKKRDSIATWLVEQSKVTPGTTLDSPSALESVKTPLPKKAGGASQMKSRTSLGSRNTLAESERSRAEAEAEAEEPFDELSPEQQRVPTQISKSKSSSSGKEEAHGADELDEENEDELSPNRQRRNTKHNIVDRGGTAIESEEEEEEEEAEPIRTKEKTQPATKKKTSVRPAPSTRKPKQKPPAASMPRTEPTVKRTRRKEDNVPITVYRLSNASKLLYRNEDDDEDPLRNPNLASIAGVNAVDVLFQITHEITERHLDSITHALQAEGEERHRAELKRKRPMVEMFKNHLSDRLFELTEAVDTGTTLKKRLKAALKKRLALTDELLSIRKQREEQQLRMDSVRDNHEASTRQTEKLSSLNTALYDIELALKRGRQFALDEGRADEPLSIPLDMVLQDMASRVTANQTGCGLVRQARGMNDLLEKTAGVLEGRT